MLLCNRFMAGHSKWVSILHRRGLWDGKLGYTTVAAGEGYESVRYEGYGPGDSAVLIDCLTRYPERLAMQIRATLREHGGALGANGSVGYLFHPVGLLIYPSGTSVESLTRAAVEAGAEEVVRNEDRSVEVVVDPIEFNLVQGRLASKGFNPSIALMTERAATSVLLDGEPALRMLQMLQSLIDLDDTQNVYTNAEIPDEVVAGF
jgi:transcriptional/translational regulatory protein YebC/TACO1